MAKIRQEINIITHLGFGSSSAAVDLEEIIQIDTNKYNNATYYFEIVAKNPDNDYPHDIILVYGSTTTITVPVDTNDPRRFRSVAFTPTSGVDDYHVRLSQYEGAAQPQIEAARIVIIQDATNITKTETQVEIGNYETDKNNIVSAPLDSPKYWYYNSANYDGTVAFYAEVTYACSSTKYVLPDISIEQDDGSFGNWTPVTNGIIVTDGNTTVPTRVRTSTAFTPVSGRNYRLVAYGDSTKYSYDIYNAKIIIEQTDATAITKFEPRYLILNRQGSWGLVDQETKWDVTEWDGVSNNYYHEAAGGASIIAKLQYDPNGTPTDVTNSDISGSNRVRSSALTMPSANDIDTNVTQANYAYSSSIIVVCVIAAGEDIIKVINETLNISETKPYVRGRYKIVNETLNIAEQTNKLRTLVRVVDENLNISENIVKLRALIRIRNESLNISEIISPIRGRFKVINEQLNISEQVNKVKGIIKVINENLNISENVNYWRGRFKVVDEQLQISEQVNKSRTLTRIVDETLNISETIVKGRNRIKIINEQLNISELKNYIRGRLKVVDEQLHISEQVNKVRGLVKVVDEQLNISEQINKVRDIVKVVNENLQISELTNYFRGRFKVVNEQLNISENIVRLRSLVRIIDENLNISETIVRARNRIKIINEQLNISENIIKLRSIIKVINEQLNISEIIVRARDRIKVINEQLQISETIVKTKKFYEVIKRKFLLFFGREV